ncbi:MAG TPA: hypothetical protein VMS12_04485 [Thermoanaerobaculia bacterium]|nr:hypothetical protein [Thermoanaerobaculia bacterium]
MLPIVLLALAFLGTFIASRRSLVAGLAAVCVVGYAYGIVRANVPGLLSHFLFDAAVIALYLSQFVLVRQKSGPAEAARLSLWVTILLVWPALLLLVPGQDPLVQLVGLRGNVFVVPFLLLGARLRSNHIEKLGAILGVANILVVALAAAQFMVGVERFFPFSPVTELIYRSNDAGPAGQLRIPASFPSAHAFAATMVITLPLLIGGLLASRRNPVRLFFSVAILCSVMGVFMASTRLYVGILAAMFVFLMVAGGIFRRYRARWLIGLALIALIVASQERMQRFTTLFDTAFLTERLSWSVNRTFFDLAYRYPLGNGLGAGGTSVPHFLEDRIRDRVIMENEYARIMLEQGVVGLMLWGTFLGWLLVRSRPQPGEPWELSRRLFRFVVAAQFFTGLIGIGIFTAIPQSALLFLFAGWLVIPQKSFKPQRVRVTQLPPPEPIIGRAYGS